MIAAHIASWALNRRKQEGEAVHAAIASNTSHKAKVVKRKKRVLESKGDPAPVYQPTPMEQAQAREFEAAQQAARDKSNQELADQRQAAKDKEALQRWTGSRDATFNNVQQYGRDQLNKYGLGVDDPYGINQTFTNRLTQAKSALQDNQDFSSTLNNTVFDNILADTRGSQRNKLTKGYTGALGDDYLNTTFGDTTDDSILESILGSQYDTAQQDVKNARDRGQLNDITYNTALNNLNNAKTGARGKLQTIGKGVLSTDLDNTKGIYQSGLDKINNFDFGDTVDVNSLAGKVKDKAGGYLGSLDADIRNAIGDQKFFDTGSLIASSGASAGLSNYTPGAVSGVGTAGAAGAATANPLYKVFDDQARSKTTEGMF